MSDKNLKYILIKNSKDFIIYHLKGRLFDDKEVKEIMLEEFLPKFDTYINKIKNIYSEKTINSRVFQYKKSKLYYIESKVVLGCIEQYNKDIRHTESLEMGIQRFKNFLSYLVSDLGYILYPKGYNLINLKLDDFNKNLKLDLDKYDFLVFYYHLADIYAEKLDYLLTTIYLYRDLLQDVKDFSFEDWDIKRAKNDTIATHNFFSLKYNENRENLENVVTIKFFEDYFQLVVKFIEEGCDELFKVIKDNNIKFN